jgi:hypothetical protein
MEVTWSRLSASNSSPSYQTNTAGDTDASLLIFGSLGQTHKLTVDGLQIAGLPKTRAKAAC